MSSFLFLASLKKAAELVNGLDATRYGKLLTRILQRLHLKVCGRGSCALTELSRDSLPSSQDDQPFSEEEKEKLQGALQLEPRDIELVLDTTSFILQQVSAPSPVAVLITLYTPHIQAAYHLAKPAVLKQQLQNIGFTDDKVQTLFYT